MKQAVIYQRVEAAIILLASLFFFIHLGFNLLLFVLLLLTMDIFILGYATRNNKLGAHIYNVGHSFIIPPLLLVVGTLLSSNILLGASLIWIAHIAMDRAFGYGLKLETGFKDTHLGKIGKK